MKYLAGVLLATWAFTGSLAQGEDSEGIPPLDTQEQRADVKNLCGVNCSYVVLNALGKPIEYEEVLRSFPGVEQNGTSLRNLADFLKEKGCEVSVAYKTEKQIARARADAWHIVLLKGDERNHVVLKRADKSGGVSVIDPPASSHVVNSAELDPVERATLTIGQDSKVQLEGGQIKWGLGGLGLLAAVITWRRSKIRSL